MLTGVTQNYTWGNGNLPKSKFLRRFRFRISRFICIIARKNQNQPITETSLSGQISFYIRNEIKSFWEAIYLVLDNFLFRKYTLRYAIKPVKTESKFTGGELLLRPASVLENTDNYQSDISKDISRIVRPTRRGERDESETARMKRSDRNVMHWLVRCPQMVPLTYLKCSFKNFLNRVKVNLNLQRFKNWEKYPNLIYKY